MYFSSEICKLEHFDIISTKTFHFSAEIIFIHTFLNLTKKKKIFQGLHIEANIKNISNFGQFSMKNFYKLIKIQMKMLKCHYFQLSWFQLG